MSADDMKREMLGHLLPTLELLSAAQKARVEHDKYWQKLAEARLIGAEDESQEDELLKPLAHPAQDSGMVLLNSWASLRDQKFHDALLRSMARAVELRRLEKEWDAYREEHSVSPSGMFEYWIDAETLEELARESERARRQREWEALSEQEKARSVAVERANALARINNWMAY